MNLALRVTDGFGASSVVPSGFSLRSSDAKVLTCTGSTVKWVGPGSATVTAGYRGATATLAMTAAASKNLLRYGPVA